MKTFLKNNTRVIINVTIFCTAGYLINGQVGLGVVLLIIGLIQLIP